MPINPPRTVTRTDKVVKSVGRHTKLILYLGIAAGLLIALDVPTERIISTLGGIIAGYILAQA